MKVRKYITSINKWDDWSSWTTLNSCTGVVKFYSDGVQVKINDGNGEIEFFGSNIHYENSNATVGGNRTYYNYKGIAKQDGRTIGNFTIGILDNTYNQVYNENVTQPYLNVTMDYVWVDATTNFLGTLLNGSANQVEWYFDTELKSEVERKEKEALLAKYESEKQQQKASENLRAGIDFLLLNKTKPNVKVRESGLQYKVIQLGSGIKPDFNDSVLVDIEMALVDGTQYNKNTILINVKDMLVGLKEGLQLMPEGSKYLFYISPDMAFGAKSQDPPPNSTVIYTVVLRKVKKVT